MPISLGFILAFIGASVGLLIGIMIFGEVSNVVDCESLPENLRVECNNALDTTWTVIGILPVALFFAIFVIFGGMGDLPNIGSIFNGIKKIGRSQTTLNKHDKKIKKLSITQKILMMFGLVKVKKIE